jgi:hypothetical protein
MILQLDKQLYLLDAMILHTLLTLKQLIYQMRCFCSIANEKFWFQIIVSAENLICI